MCFEDVVEVWKAQGGLCRYSNVPIQYKRHQRYTGENTASLDRIDSSKGYTPENIQVISRIANVMKNNATEQELISFAKGVLAAHSKEDGCDVDSM